MDKLREKKPRLRGASKRRKEPYPLGEIPDTVIIGIGKQIVHRLAIGHKDITGDDFGEIFAGAIEGEHRNSPLGVADVVSNGCAWSVKTVKATNPFTSKNIRIISGRNSPDYSLGISDPRKDVGATGRAVLSIWNERVNEAMGSHDQLRVVVFIRNMATREFVLFEQEAQRYIADDYDWEINRHGNFEGQNKTTKDRMFTWQPHGAQFTIHRRVPATARKFRIVPEVPIVKAEHILRLARYSDDWIKKVYDGKSHEETAEELLDIPMVGSKSM